MTEVKDRPIDKLARSSPNFWKREWHKRDCKGCGKTFMPEARSALYCKSCSEAGKGWAGRKDKQRKDTAHKSAKVRQITPKGPRGVPPDPRLGFRALVESMSSTVRCPACSGDMRRDGQVWRCGCGLGLGREEWICGGGASAGEERRAA